MATAHSCPHALNIGKLQSAKFDREAVDSRGIKRNI